MAEPPRLLPLAAEREVDVPAASANMRAWVISACLNTACMVAARTRAGGGTCGGWSHGLTLTLTLPGPGPPAAPVAAGRAAGRGPRRGGVQPHRAASDRAGGRRAGRVRRAARARLPRARHPPAHRRRGHFQACPPAAQPCVLCATAAHSAFILP